RSTRDWSSDVCSSDLHEKDGDWGAAWLTSNEAGSGSYTLTRYDPAVGFIAKRFAGHFMPWGQKYIDEIEFRTVKEDNTRVLGMRSEERRVGKGERTER